jgi:ABC-2 type transport system permease protein
MSSSGTRAVRLVARREMRERSRSKGFRISTVVVLLGVAALVVLPKFLDSEVTRDVGVVGAVPDGFQAALEQAAGQDATVDVQSFPDAASADAALRDGSVEVVVDPSAGQIVWEEDVVDELDGEVRQAMAVVAIDKNASDLGLTSAQQQQLLAPPDLTERNLDPPDPDNSTQVGVAFASTVILFIAISTFGGFVMTSVINEKTSRIAEVLIAQVRPVHLLTGKVLGIGALAIGQLLLIVVVALVAGSFADTVTIPEVGVAPFVVAFTFFVLGFVLYATLYAAAGALVSGQEDAQSVVYPVMLPLLAGYLIAISTLGDPNATLPTILSFVPLTAPVQMPIRSQLADVAVWEVVLSALLCVATIAGVLVVAGRVYAGGLLRTGRRVKVREALSSAADVR